MLINRCSAAVREVFTVLISHPVSDRFYTAHGKWPDRAPSSPSTVSPDARLSNAPELCGPGKVRPRTCSLLCTACALQTVAETARRDAHTGRQLADRAVGRTATLRMRRPDMTLTDKYQVLIRNSQRRQIRWKIHATATVLGCAPWYGFLSLTYTSRLFRLPFVREGRAWVWLLYMHDRRRFSGPHTRSKHYQRRSNRVRANSSFAAENADYDILSPAGAEKVLPATLNDGFPHSRRTQLLYQASSQFGSWPLVSTFLGPYSSLSKQSTIAATAPTTRQRDNN
ncbi:hypothetical protein C8Q80DRAFT_290336 [Daedaleopsis nitida]|nr:hypothetical protein C8Q80DRAFT_290336 [Daedaleopsis nitida]